MTREDDGWLKDEDEVTEKDGEMNSAQHKVIDVMTRWQEKIGRGREVYLVSCEGLREDDEKKKNERGREERVCGGRLWISNMVSIGSRKGKLG